jgi:hypothetical protein
MVRVQDYYSPDYFSARHRFREAVGRAGGRLETLAIAARGPAGEPLTIDIGWFGPEVPRRALLHSSGLHGVEGFGGSAIQLQLLDDLPRLAAETAVLLVHILNPYGMAWLRRVNENNVDLNRNCRAANGYRGAPERYAKLNHFLNPPTPPGFDFFFAKSACLILRYGMTALKQTVAGGQYEFPNGLFFGGKQMEEGLCRYRSFLIERLGSVEKAIVIDVHTGLGRFAEHLLLVDSRDYAPLRDLFGTRVTALEPDRGAAYRVEGGLESMIFSVFTKTRPCFIGQEFGTYSSMSVLHALREENRWHRFGNGALDHPAKRNLKRVFCPDSELWRAAVLKQGRELLDRAVAVLEQGGL